MLAEKPRNVVVLKDVSCDGLLGYSNVIFRDLQNVSTALWFSISANIAFCKTTNAYGILHRIYLEHFGAYGRCCAHYNQSNNVSFDSAVFITVWLLMYKKLLRDKMQEDCPVTFLGFRNFVEHFLPDYVLLCVSL